MQKLKSNPYFKNFHNKYNKYTIVLILIKIGLSIQISEKNKFFIIKLKSYEIELKIRGKGQNNIFNPNFNSTYFPKKVFINQDLINEINYTYNFTENVNSVKLIWDDKIKSCNSMFYGCNDIYEFDFSNFDTSEVTNMFRMFCDCNSLISLDLSNFITSQVKIMWDMFSGCLSLISLNLSNFITTHVEDMEYMFKNCKKLEYINLQNFDEIKLINSTSYYGNMFDNVPENVVVCIDEEKNKNKIFPQLKIKKCFINNCSKNWKMSQKKICGDNIKDYIQFLMKEINETQTREEEIKYNDNILKNIEIGFTSEDYDTFNLDNGENIIMKADKMIITLSNINNQNKTYENMTSIDLGVCEVLLRKYYNISNSMPLYMKKIDIIQEGIKIPKIEYDVYCKLTGKNLIKLNLTACENSKILLNLPINISENLDILNSKSGYYNDICYITTSDSGTDISLKDRKKDFIDNNRMICQEDCDLEEYNKNTHNVICSCKAKESSSSYEFMNIDKKKIFKSFIDIKNIANINLMKCYKILFTKEGLKKNIGSYLLIIIILLHIMVIIIFFVKKSRKIKKKIKQIIFAIKHLKLLRRFKKNKEHEKNSQKETENVNNNDKSDNKLAISIKKNTPNLNKKINNNNEKDSKNEKKVKKVKKIMKYKDDEINELSYKQALKIDKRKFCAYYFSLLKSNHELIFAFCNNRDYNSRIIKIDLFFLGFTIFYTINALFYNDDTMHKIYQNKGKFDFISQLPEIIYSSVISMLLSTLLKILALSHDDILQLKQIKSGYKIKNEGKILNKKLRIKFILYFIISFIFLLFFWYYLSMFCAIYRNTQFHLLKDTLISFILSLIYPIGFYLLPGLFRIPSLSKNNKNREILYNISKIIQLLLTF